MTLLLAFILAQQGPVALDGWKVEVVAEYPKIKHPSVLCFAPDGRLFVGEDPMDMDGPTNKPIDRILCFHPDGKVTVFAEGLFAVFGIQYLDGKLYVHHTPKFSVFTDDNGIGKDRVDLIECTNPAPSLNGGGFNDHIPSNCRIGMDGYLYVSIGDKGLYGAVGKDGRTAQIYGGGVFRIRPDGTDMEVFSTGTRNHLDVALNAEDEVFTYDNTDDGHGWWTRVTHMVDGGFYGYPWDYKPRRPYTLWMMGDYGGGSGCASIAYNEDALPKEYHGNLFLSDWARKQVLRVQAAREGGSYAITAKENFLTTKGGDELRPLGLAWSPDGMSLYVCDWNYGGWVAKGKQTGRLIKMTWTGTSQAAEKPAWIAAAGTARKFEASNAELAAALSHPAQSVRLIAQRRLADRKAIRELETVLASGKAPAKWHAIWALDAIGGSKAIVAALRDPDPSVRRQAARQAGTRKVQAALTELYALLKDPDASVRFHAATAIGRIGVCHILPLLEALEEKDLFARYAVFTALNRIGRAYPVAWGEIIKGLESPSERVREGTLFALRETYDASLVTALSNMKSPLALTALAELHRRPADWTGKWWGTQPVAQPRPAKTIEYAGTKIVLDAVRGALGDANPAVRKAAIDGVPVVKDPGAAPALRELFGKETDGEVKKSILRALGALKDAAAAPLVSGALKDPALQHEAVWAAEQIGGAALVKGLIDVIEPAGVPAIEALGRLKAASAAGPLAGQLQHKDPKVVQAVVASLTAIGGAPAIQALLPVLTDKRADVRRATVTALGALKAKEALAPLLRAYIDPETRFEAVGALAQIPDLRALDAYIEGLGGKNATLRQQCSAAVAAVHGPALPLIETKLAAQQLSAEVIQELQRIYNRPAPIVDWSILGSFPKPCAEPFPVDAVPLDREFTDSRGKPIRWKKAKVSPEHGAVEMRNQATVPDDSNAYAYAEIASESEREVELLAGADDSLTIWLNGRKIYEELGDGGWKFDEIRVRGTLKAGKNALLLKSGNTGGGWMFSVAYPPSRKGPLFEASAKKLDPKAYEKHALAGKGDIARGKALFSDLKGVACIKCHKVDGAGGEVGPDLKGIGAKYSRAQLIESVLFPSKQILDGYKQTMVLTQAGDVKSGRLAAETPEELILLDAEGKRLAFKKSEIDQRKESDLSLMPDGLNTGLSLQDLSDIVSFLESLR